MQQATIDWPRYLPLILPIVALQLILLIAALRDIMKRKSTHGSRQMWIFIVVFINILGPVLYFVFGRKED